MKRFLFHRFINQKMTGYTHLQKLQYILEWAHTCPDFNPTLFISIKNKNPYRLTIRQTTAIDNVFYKWGVDKWIAEL